MTYAACSLALIAAGTDLWSRRIPNLLVLAGLLAGLLFGIITGGFNGLVLALMGTSVGLGLLLIPYLTGGMGAGDVKLLMALGAILGPTSVFWVFIYSCLAGGVMALMVMIVSGKWRVLMADCLLPLGIVVPFSSSLPPKSLAIPYGVAIAAGVIIFLLQGNA